MKLIKLITIVGIIALFLTILSSLFSIFHNSDNNFLETIATIISIVLAVISIIYTYVSGQQTLKDIKKINDDNKALVDEITRLKLKDSFNFDNIDNIKNSNLH